MLRWLVRLLLKAVVTLIVWLSLLIVAVGALLFLGGLILGLKAGLGL